MMKNEHGQEVCAHPGCTCRPRENSKYCSQYCEDAGGTLELSCNCGHDGCGVEALSDSRMRDLTPA
jgi:hypothetical protein